MIQEYDFSYEIGIVGKTFKFGGSKLIHIIIGRVKLTVGRMHAWSISNNSKSFYKL